jgi:hypothetical protein
MPDLARFLSFVCKLVCKRRFLLAVSLYLSVDYCFYAPDYQYDAQFIAEIIYDIN